MQFTRRGLHIGVQSFCKPSACQAVGVSATIQLILEVRVARLHGIIDNIMTQTE